MEGLELFGLVGLLQALMTDDHSFGCMNDRLELEVDGREPVGLPSNESCLLGDDIGDRNGFKTTELAV